MAILDSESAKKIELYKENFPQCKINRIQPVELQGKRVDLEVYRLPLSLLKFNIRNGRFAAEYKALKSEVGRDLDVTIPEDDKRIKNLLLTQNANATKILMEDLVRVGQKNPGIITYDGYVINGNRRMAILRELNETTGEDKYNYIEVSILPRGTKEVDLWRIEAGLQFSREERLTYGEINKLLKFREGIEAGLTPKQIAASLYGGFSEEQIEEDLERLKLIDNYLIFLKKPDEYKYVEDLNEHFIELRSFLTKYKNTPDIDLVKVTKFAFDLIKNKVRHKDLRYLRKIMAQQNAKKKFVEGLNNNPDIVAIVGPKKSFACSEPPNVERQQAKMVPLEPQRTNTGKDAPSMQLFSDVTEAVDAAEEKDKPILLITRAITNLQSVDPIKLKRAEIASAKRLLDELYAEVDRIKNGFNGS